MTVKLNKSLKFALCFMVAAASLFCIMLTEAFAEGTYISEVTVVSGNNAAKKLEKSGYTVLFQGMNVISDEDSAVFLGYKEGTEAITDLVVSAEKSDTIEIGSAVYSLVSDVSLNKGTAGTPLYLYYTKSKAAGYGITSLDTVSGLTEKESVIPLKNDGSAPVRTESGKLADFDAGISGSELYLLMYRGGRVEKFISEVRVISAGSEKAAVKSAAGSGFNYYIDCDIDDSDGVSYVCYNRTASKSDAVTYLTISGRTAKTEKDENATAFLLDITDSELFDSSFELGEWIKYYSYCNNSDSRDSSVYTSLLKSKDLCSCVRADGAGRIYACYLGDIKSSRAASAAATSTAASATSATSATSAESAATTASVTAATTAAASTTTVTTAAATEPQNETVPETDEYISNEKTETEEVIVVTDSGTEGSAIGSGNIIAIICSAVLIILVSAGLVIFRTRKGRKKHEEK